nr:thioredoxin family protein [Saprospiraceae bacterium]
MKQLSLLIVVTLLAFNVYGQTDNYQPAHEGWLVEIEDAYNESQATGKPIMAFFTGSDWCPPCKRFSAAVINKPEFNTWAKDKVVLLELDSPKRKSVPNEIRQQNESLKQAFKVTGVPTIWVFNLNKNSANDQFEIDAIGKTGYNSSFEQFTNTIEEMLN